MSGPEIVFEDLKAVFGYKGSTKVSFSGQDPIVPSVHHLSDAASAALAIMAASFSEIYQIRGGEAQDVEITADGAIRQLMAVFQTSLNSVPVVKLFEDPTLFNDSDFYRARDGRYVYLLLTYPHLREIACDVLDCAPKRDRFTDAVAKWDSFALEEAISKRGGTCIAVRTSTEWLEHPQGRYQTNQPLIRIERIADGPVLQLTAGSVLPLNDLRVIDNTHVIAGPIAGRLLAEHGAEVIHLSSPAHPDPQPMHIETNMGKRCAFCDLDEQGGREDFWNLLYDADIYISSYLSLEKKGFGPVALAKRRPGIIFLDFHGWGVEGPWSQRGGFDQLACSATGFSVEEGSFDGPKLPPTYLLNDYLAAILGAAGVGEALHRRTVDGGSYRVHLDLARICMWVQSLGIFPVDRISDLRAPIPGEVSDKLIEVAGAAGVTRYLPTQIKYSSLRPNLKRGAEPLGSSPRKWQ